MCYEPRNEEFAKVCLERDELKAALDGAKLVMKALNEKMVQVTAERDELKKENVSLLEELKYARGVMTEEYEKVKYERDAFEELKRRMEGTQ